MAVNGAEPAAAPRCGECGARPEREGDANQEITRCEWCGAEYIVSATD